MFPIQNVLLPSDEKFIFSLEKKELILEYQIKAVKTPSENDPNQVMR